MLLDGGNADDLEDGGVEVAQSVAGELAEDGYHQDLSYAPTSAVGQYKGAIYKSSLVMAVETKLKPSEREKKGGGGELQGGSELTIPRPLINAILANPILHLLDLELHEPRGRVVVAMILDQERDRLFLAAVGDQEPWRLGDKPDTAHYDDTGKPLNNQGDPPGVVVVDLVAAVDDGGCGDGSAEPAAVVESCK